MGRQAWVLAFLLLACGEPADPVEPRVERSDSAIPRLADDRTHLSMIVGFDAYPTRVAVRVESRWQEAIDAGMDVGR
ncbi:MAG: hypothetical protein AAFQ82_18105, partial [Myxococcota bacterium]